MAQLGVRTRRAGTAPETAEEDDRVDGGDEGGVETAGGGWGEVGALYPPKRISQIKLANCGTGRATRGAEGEGGRLVGVECCLDTFNSTGESSNAFKMAKGSVGWKESGNVEGGGGGNGAEVVFSPLVSPPLPPRVNWRKLRFRGN
ncbi:hypothetical protein GWI33_001564 [Rhynchophorus ferrugineus]|uniref:Uncharacterized protein n=1 Tax=Rhynchophorus ferrugineus TaxID=354439 RepID=A0A834MGV3_RHYFE|nr:hypothetical protein GWI33_001564 [Rhynchophorus ferrugineus]